MHGSARKVPGDRHPKRKPRYTRLLFHGATLWECAFAEVRFRIQDKHG